MSQLPWVSFCISTYKRPLLLEKQLRHLMEQTIGNFEIVVSDNDPEASAGEVIKKINDTRIRYFHNGENLGMIKSFNKSIERATTEYIIMVTDDDPVDPSFLTDFSKLIHEHPGYASYAGFERRGKRLGEVEIIQQQDFIAELLDPDKTPNLLWSSCIMRKTTVMEIGMIPDYGSPHLADHAFIAMAGSRGGGVMMNKMYSSLTSHDTNYSKSNFTTYIEGCIGFYNTLNKFCQDANAGRCRQVVEKHLRWWFIGCTFNLKKYFTYVQPDAVVLSKVNEFADKILQQPFMKKFKTRYHIKNTIFKIKKLLGLHTK